MPKRPRTREGICGSKHLVWPPLRRLTMEVLEDRTVLSTWLPSSGWGESDLQSSGNEAAVVIGANLREDDGGVAGNLIPDSRVTVGSSFFVEIVAEDVRQPAAGLVGLSLDINWDPSVLIEIDAPFDPADPASPLVTAAFPLFRGGTLSNPLGMIDELRGGSLPATGLGAALGNETAERFSLLRFQAVATTAATPLVLELGSYGASLADGVSGFELSFVLPTIQVISDSTPWQNTPPWDVNDDGRVHPDDVLYLINDLNHRGTRPLPVPPIPPDVPPPYLDVSGNNWIEPRDVLLVINYINWSLAPSRPASVAAGEAEASSAISSPIASGTFPWVTSWQADRIWPVAPGGPAMVSGHADSGTPLRRLLDGQAPATRPASHRDGVPLSLDTDRALVAEPANASRADETVRLEPDFLSFDELGDDVLADLAPDTADGWRFMARGTPE